MLRRIDEHGVTLMCGAPAVVAAILDAASARRAAGQPVPGRDRVRIVVAGAPPPSKTIERVEEELGWEFIQIYGLTETAPLLTVNRRPAEWDELPAPSGPSCSRGPGAPAVGVQVAVDGEGEVLARSNHVFAGYWEQPEESAKVLVDGWFHTGDEGHIDADEYLVISDRKKDVIISGGENVSSIEVEDCLFQHPAVAEAAVIGVPSEQWGETIKALVVVRPGQQVRGGADRVLPVAAGALQVPDLGRGAGEPGADGDRQAAEVQAAGAVLGRVRAAGELRSCLGRADATPATLAGCATPAPRARHPPEARPR